MLTSRMLTIALLAGINDIVADIGCDHGKLSAYLIKNGLASVVYATDISEKSLQKAIELSKREKIENIEFFLGDGFYAFNKSVDCAIVAGMGGETICEIIEHNCAKTKLVLQPMKDSEILYKHLIESGFYIEKVQIVREGGRFYEIVLCVPGKDEPFDYSLPPIDKLVMDENSRDFFIHKLEVLKRAFNCASMSKKDVERFNEISKNINKIEDVLSNVYGF